MFKKSFFIVAVCAMTLSLQAAKETHKLQVLFNPEAFQFYLNAGDGITTNQGAPRPAGSYFLGVGGWILPAGTIHKSQTSYLVDHDGNTITEDDAIGFLDVFEKMLTTVDFSSFPAEGTTVELSEWTLIFKEECYHDEPNTIIGQGYAQTGVLEFGSKIFTYTLAMTGGTGCNDHDNTMIAKAYLAPDGQSTLIKIKFTKEIKYND
jgi:hypothetical protein